MKEEASAQVLETLSEIALSEAEQMKITTKRSRTQFHVSHASGSCAHEGTGDDDEDDDDADNQGDDAQDDDNEQTESDNDGDDFVHPKLSTFDKEEKLKEKQDEEEEGDNVEEEKLDEDKTNEEEVDELYSDVNINLEEIDTDMTDASLANSSSVSLDFISNMLNPTPDTGIDFILNLNTESTSLVDVSVTTNLEIPPSYVTTLHPPLIPLIQPQQQTPAPSPAIVSSTSLQNLPTFRSLFKFEDRVKALEDDFLEFNQTNLFAETVSSILGIVDAYLANKMNEVIKTVVQLQSNRLRDEGQAKNEDFINKLDENIKKSIKEQVKVQVKEKVSKILPRIKKLVNDQLESEVLTCSSNETKTSHAIAVNLFKLELKKILIDKMKTHKSIHQSDQQKTLYKALINAYETDKVILDTYRDTVMIKRRRDDKDDEEEPSIGSNRGNLARKDDSPDSFDELMDTHLDFLAFSLVELEYFLEEVYKETIDQLDWNNPEGRQYPHDLRKPLPLIPNSQGRRVIPFDHFINNDLAYLRGGALSQTYATSVTQTKASDYGHMKWIEDLVPSNMWSLVSINYDKHALWGISHWGRKRQQFYGYAVNKESTRDVYSRHIIIVIIKRKDKKNRLIRIDELHKFSDDTLNDVRTALDDIMKRIRMKYLPQTYWRNVDKERAGAMIQEIDKKLKNRRIMRSLEKFVGGRPTRETFGY
nr:hypothetical protein [Tanacetum cinerariifolium]